MPGVLKDSSSRARALARQRDTEISRNAFLVCNNSMKPLDNIKMTRYNINDNR